MGTGRILEVDAILMPSLASVKGECRRRRILIKGRFFPMAPRRRFALRGGYQDHQTLRAIRSFTTGPAPAPGSGRDAHRAPNPLGGALKVRLHHVRARRERPFSRDFGADRRECGEPDRKVDLAIRMLAAAAELDQRMSDGAGVHAGNEARGLRKDGPHDRRRGEIGTTPSPQNRLGRPAP